MCFSQEIGGKFDLVMATLMQYLDFLNANLSVLQLAANLPNFESLTRSYGLKPQFAFAIARPALRVSLIAAINAPKVRQCLFLSSKCRDSTICVLKGSTEPLEPLDASIVPWDFRSVRECKFG